MSYSLQLYFDPEVQHKRMLSYFAARKYYAVADGRASYENHDTGVYFSIVLRCVRNVMFRKRVVAAEFEINYNRPSFFGIEAERELWNFGNLFAVRSRLSDNPDRDIPSMAADELHTTWTWNYQRAERNRLHTRCFVSRITLSRIKEHPCRVVVWPQGTPILLPEVDYVLVGRIAAGEKRYGLASWSEVLDVVQRAGSDTARTPSSSIMPRRLNRSRIGSTISS